MDQRLDEVRRASSNLFFSMASWLQAPDRDDIEHMHEFTSVLKDHHRHAERCLGVAAAHDAVEEFLEISGLGAVGLDEGRIKPTPLPEPGGEPDDNQYGHRRRAQAGNKAIHTRRTTVWF